MSGPRYDRILASTALALILAAPLGAAAVAQEAAAPTTAESAAQRAAAKYANAALDAAITPQSKNELPAQAPELAGASSVVVSPAPAPAPGQTSAVPKDAAAPAAAPGEAPAAAKDAAAPATPANPTIAIEQNVAPDPWLRSIPPTAWWRKRFVTSWPPSRMRFSPARVSEGGRILLSESNLRSPLARQRRCECARDGGDCAPQGGRCRWPRSQAIIAHPILPGLAPTHSPRPISSSRRRC